MRDRIKQRELRRANRRLKYDNNLDTKNAEGYNDYTPYNAINNKDLLSKTNIINPGKRALGSYNG